MSKVAVVYWSGTGNTALMAQAVADGAKAKGADCDLLTSAEFTASMLDSYDAVAFGCPAMGAEVLEESEFEPMFAECEPALNGKKIDHSAARGNMAVRELIVFKHSKELGDCPAYKLFDAVKVKKKDTVEYPRKYQDYDVTVCQQEIPDSVEVRRMN